MNGLTIACVISGVMLSEAPAAEYKLHSQIQTDTLPSHVRTELRRQKERLEVAFFEMETKSFGTLKSWRYDVSPRLTAYFEQQHFYQRFEASEDPLARRELAFDGTSIWKKLRGTTFKYPFPDAKDVLDRKFAEWNYLEAAAYFVPAYGPEVDRFTSIESLACTISIVFNRHR